MIMSYIEIYLFVVKYIHVYAYKYTYGRSKKSKLLQ